MSRVEEQERSSGGVIRVRGQALKSCKACIGGSDQKMKNRIIAHSLPTQWNMPYVRPAPPLVSGIFM